MGDNIKDIQDAWEEATLKHMQGQHNQKLHGNRGMRTSNEAIKGLPANIQSWYNQQSTKDQVKFRLAWYRLQGKNPNADPVAFAADFVKKNLASAGGAAAPVASAGPKAPKTPKAPKAAPPPPPPPAPAVPTTPAKLNLAQAKSWYSSLPTQLDKNRFRTAWHHELKKNPNAYYADFAEAYIAKKNLPHPNAGGSGGSLAAAAQQAASSMAAQQSAYQAKLAAARTKRAAAQAAAAQQQAQQPTPPAKPVVYHEYSKTDAYDSHNDFYAQQQWQDWHNNINSQERWALNKYINDKQYYKDVNDILRNPSRSFDPNAYPNSAITRGIKSLDDLTARGELHRDMMLFRGRNTKNWHNFTNDDGTPMKVGQIIPDAGFGSTATKRDTAMWFSTEYKYPPNPAMMRIKAPKGTKGAYMSWNDVNPNYMHETEFLMPRNVKYKITGMHYENIKYTNALHGHTQTYKVAIIEVEIVP